MVLNVPSGDGGGKIGSSYEALPWDFPGGPVVKNPPASSGDPRAIPGPGKSHMPWSNEAHGPQLLSPWATSIEALVP